jgi:hypothetical protein
VALSDLGVDALAAAVAQAAEAEEEPAKKNACMRSPMVLGALRDIAVAVVAKRLGDL